MGKWDDLPDKSEMSTCEASSFCSRVRERVAGVMPVEAWVSAADVSVFAAMVGDVIRVEEEKSREGSGWVR